MSWAGALGVLTSGLQQPDVALAALRLGVGIPFAISGWNKLTCPTCHGYLFSNLTRSQIPCPAFSVWWVAGWEFVAGLTLAAGFFTGASAFILFVVCLVAFVVSWRRKLAKKNPVHFMDACTEIGFMFDVLLLWMLLAVMLLGPGAYSFDSFLWGHLLALAS